MKKALVSKKIILWKESFTYDERGRCIRIVRTDNISDKVLITIENEFYSKDDLPGAER